MPEGERGVHATTRSHLSVGKLARGGSVGVQKWVLGVAHHPGPLVAHVGDRAAELTCQTARAPTVRVASACRVYLE
jgi:hypothetical protein